MFKKHQSYFKEKNIFDLAPYDFNGLKLSQITSPHQNLWPVGGSLLLVSLVR